MRISGIEVELVQKDIKNLHLAVYPPDGRVRLAAPLNVNEKTLELYVISKLPWIRRQQRKFEGMDRQTERQYVSRESHFFLGRRYILKIHDIEQGNAASKIVFDRKKYINLYVQRSALQEEKAKLVREWYRAELKAILLELIPKWESTLGVKANKIRIQTMRTKWGSCNTDNENMTFNVELAKKSMECIEYVVVHELIHLLERNHNDRFRACMDKYMPRWEHIREELNR
jgi:predicted metal-dependent hydrolase